MKHKYYKWHNKIVFSANISANMWNYTGLKQYVYELNPYIGYGLRGALHIVNNSSLKKLTQKERLQLALLLLTKNANTS